MKIWLPLVLVVSLFAAACGSGSDSDDSSDGSVTSDAPSTDAETTDPPAGADAEDAEDSATAEPAPAPVEVFSDDGEVGVRVSAADADVDVSIRVLDPSEWPEAVAGGENVPGVTIYELEPDGATFEEPVTVTRRLDLDRFADLELGPEDVPLLTMVTQNDAGEFELMDDLSLLRMGDSLLVTATTTHFSPVIISNESTRMPIDIDSIPSVDVLSGSDIDRAALTEGLRGVADEEPFGGAVISSLTVGGYVESIFARRPIEPVAEDEQLFVPPEWAAGEFDVQPLRVETEVDYPGADMALRARRVGSTFSGIPMSWAPSASTLLGDPDVEFEMTVAVLQLFVDEEVLEEAIEEVIDDALDAWVIPDEVDFVYEVFHRIYGVYPSSVVKRYRNLRLPEGLVGYTTTWEGDIGPDGRLVSIGELTADGDDLVGEAGIECFCEYLEALLVVAGGFDPDTLDSLTSPGAIEFLQEGESTDEDLEIALALLTNPTTDENLELNFELRRFQVTAEEGVIHDDVGLFVEALAVIP